MPCRACAGQSYFFSGQQYWQFNDARMRVQRGYPRPIAQHWFACSPNQPSSSRHDDDDDDYDDDDVTGSSVAAVSLLRLTIITLVLVGLLVSHTALQ